MIEFELSESRPRPGIEDRSSSSSPPHARTVPRGCGGRSSADPPRKGSGRRRDEGGAGDQVRCTGRQCRSCTGGVVADCVAICCCPCAVLNCLALAFVKIPYLIGKRWCVGFRRKRKRKEEEEEEGRKPVSPDVDHGEGDGCPETNRGNAGCTDNEESWFEIRFEEQGGAGRARDAEEVWVELCEFNHLSFGRVSFAGMPLPTNVRLES
ncbi:hypothetical protein MLD38_033960 [Melastoma candidum]|uniref:Uncharacterized protein n=1 Tax=Melastoma candidum TaxID=119954 RepID=A0ACB9M8X4_9MYRT|nr:hypothetical protein MLD38_033960 [Melastoma candidum]